MQLIHKLLIFSILGISILLFSTSLPPKEIYSDKGLLILLENQNIITKSKISSISTTQTFTFITLENEVIVKANKNLDFIKGKTILVQGTKESYDKNIYIKAKKITFLQS